MNKKFIGKDCGKSQKPTMLIYKINTKVTYLAILKIKANVSNNESKDILFNLYLINKKSLFLNCFQQDASKIKILN